MIDQTPSLEFPSWLDAELRSDHAGETGAVMIYRGILDICPDPAIRAFAQQHMRTEQNHLDLLETMLPAPRRSLLLPIWRVAGWLTGAIPSVVGPSAVYATIDAVETFVDHHYRQQIERLDAEGIFPALRDQLEQCRVDEVHHRDEARAEADHPASSALRAWCWLVGFGSQSAVKAAKIL